LFTAVGFPPFDSGPNTCTQKAKMVKCIKRRNTGHRTHTIESKTYKTKEQK
jgi:hypothetical protein